LKLLCQLTAALVLAGALGCGSNDPNKNLKPVDPKTPPPKMVQDGAEKPSPIIK
jgi:hypothetical protein